MSRAFEVTSRANEDLRAIAEYTLERWGGVQMARYLGEINDRFGWLAENPDLGQRRDGLRPNLRAFRQGSHLIFYRHRYDFIEIIAVIHQSSDFETKLRDRP